MRGTVSILQTDWVWKSLTRRHGRVAVGSDVCCHRRPPGDPHHTAEHDQPDEHEGMSPLGAHCHLGLGKHRQARACSGAPHHATPMYREMRMIYWLEKAERQRGELQWPIDSR